MSFDPSAPLDNFSPAAACAAADQLRALAGQAPAGMLDQLGGQEFLNGMPSNLVSQLGPMLGDAAPADMLGAVNTAAGALQDPAQFQQLVDSLPAGALDQLAAAAPGGSDLAKLVKDNIPAFLAEQIPNLAALAQAAGLPGIPPMPNLPGLPALPGMPAIPGAPDFASMMQGLQNQMPGMPFMPQQVAGLVGGLAAQAPGLYQQALEQIPVPPIPRVLPEDVPLPDPTDLTEAVASCAETAGMTHEEKVTQALGMAPPLPPEVAQAMGGAPSAIADEFVGGMGEVANQLNECPGMVQEAAGMMSLLGGPANVPIADVTQGLQGLTDAYGATACDGAQSMQDLANAGSQLQKAAEQMPADALAGMF